MNTDEHGWRERKLETRIQIRALLKNLSPERHATDSENACELLQQQNAWHNAAAILFFAPLKDELNVWPLLEIALASGKTVALPRFDSGTNRYVIHQIRTLASDIQPGRYDIREPKPDCPAVPLNRLDLTLVPGIAFDPHGRRLGRGKGYYDQLLADVRGKICGVAFDEQIVAEIPVEPHDIRLNCILTPTRWIEP
jgi:5-formyltetrahydrofolate cyclo-ligase